MSRKTAKTTRAPRAAAAPQLDERAAYLADCEQAAERFGSVADAMATGNPDIVAAARRRLQG